MVELVPYPFGSLVQRALRELDRNGSVFDLPATKFFTGGDGCDLSVRFHGKTAATPLGPAAGPHSQMAQNIVLAWLGGARILELKTVQVRDRLQIPRPCIDMHNIGFNVEWSQELRLEQSLEEYVKAAMLIEVLRASGALRLPDSDPVVFDMSVGYDLAGIRSERVQAFIAGMLDATALVDRLRRELPREYRDLDFASRLSDTLTLSTFHGCPPDEIEQIIEFLLRELRLHCVVKLNPTLLGPAEIRGLLHDQLGYRELHTPDAAFAKDTCWPDAVAFTERLTALAASLGLGFGVKFSNTLIVENHRDFFPSSEREMYLSGPPLHVLAMHLVQRFRAHFGARVPISFSAGIDRHNFPDAVGLGLVPVTVCSDLLKPGGYARQHAYFAELRARMRAAGATTVDDFVRRYADSSAPVEDLGEAQLRNTDHYLERLARDPRYHQGANREQPKKIGSQLELFDCITCDKCVPVCPNDANFTFVLPQQELPIVKLRRAGDRWQQTDAGTLVLARQHQIGNVADFCNECGNCDVFCPEDGGPYVVKPRFFVDRRSWHENRSHDGFWLARDDGAEVVLGRFAGREFTLTARGDDAEFGGADFDVRFRVDDPGGTVSGEAAGEVDLTYWAIMDQLRRALLADGAINYLAVAERP